MGSNGEATTDLAEGRLYFPLPGALLLPGDGDLAWLGLRRSHLVDLISCCLIRVK
jgi:hypothetical protein